VKFNSLARARVIGPTGWSTIGACGGGVTGGAWVAAGVDVFVVSSSVEQREKQGIKHKWPATIERVSTKIQLRLFKECARLNGCWDRDLVWNVFLFWFLWTVGREKHSIKLTDQPGNLIPLDRGEVPDLLVSGDNFDWVVVDPHDPTTMSEPEAPMQSLNQLPMVTNLAGTRSAWSRRSIPARNRRTNKKKTRAILLSLEGGVLNYTRQRRLARVQE
jgi:hypothetical protein